MSEMTIALAGNPNVGKSTLFNALTGGRQHVGNWPGKTVEKKEGSFRAHGKKTKIVDLPGAYSLTAYSIEEVIARDYIVKQKPDAVIQIIDSTNLERNLYLAIQLIELGANLVIALNMVALAKGQGIEIDEKKLSKLLGVPVVKIEANKKTGIGLLIKKTLSATKKQRKKLVRYGNEIEEHLEKVKNKLREEIELPEDYSADWIALKILESDKEIISFVRSMPGGKRVLDFSEKEKKHLERVFGEDIDTAIADARYGFISGLAKETVKKNELQKITFSEQADKLVLSRALGIPIFLLVMWLMFTITFEVGAPLVALVDEMFGLLGETATAWLAAANAPEWVISLAIDGIIGGIGGVFVFIPNIFLLFLVIAFLEDSGYLARAAFIMDRVMHKIGLHGKSFIPMILGFGCNVPAIMATRTLESKKDRILTILINPLMSCSARLPVYALFVGAFFSHDRGLIIWSIYLTGIILAIIMGFIFKKAFFKGLSSPFVMELPPYRIPTITGLLIHTWERSKQFIKKAGTIILAASIVIWFLASIPFGVEYGSKESVVGAIGTGVAPVFAPLGFGNWQSSVALIFGLAAKEVVVGTFGTLYGTEEGLVEAIQREFTPLSAYSFMLFTLIYIPCLATIAVIKKETGSWKWAGFAVVYSITLAWLVSFLFYQGGIMLGFG